MTNLEPNTGDFTCREALPLVPSYLDGELSEVRAGLLRKHLMDCAACRTSAQDGKALSRWFVRPERAEIPVPSGFAARVARRAFAGDVGSSTGSAGREEEVGAREQGRILQFVLTLTAAAAAVMLIAAVGLRDRELSGDGKLRARNQPPSKDEVLLQLDELNRREAARDAAHGTANAPAADASGAKKP